MPVSNLLDHIRSIFNKGQLNTPALAEISSTLAQAVESLNDTAVATVGPWSNVLYVDNVRGNDTTGTRGDDNLPFATIQAALNAMQTNDLVLLAPQRFVLTATLTIPSAVVNGGLSGSVAAVSPIASAPQLQAASEIRFVGGNVFNLGANLGLTLFQISNVFLTSTTLAISADGSAYAKNAFLSQGLWLYNVTLFGDITTKYVTRFEMMNSRSETGTHTHTNGNAFNYTQCYSPVAGNIFAYDATDPLATTATMVAQVRDASVLGATGSLGFITLTGQAFLSVDESSTIGGLKGVGLAASGVKVPGARVAGYIGGANSGAIDFATAGSELPDTATAMVWDFRGARLSTASPVPAFTTQVVTAKFKVGGAATNFQTVKLDSTTTLPGVTFTADAKIHLTMRGADAPQAVYTTPGADGDITPPMLTGTVDISAGGAVAKTWVQLGYAGLIRTGATPDTAFLTDKVQAANGVVNASSTTGLTLISSPVAGNTANWQAIWK